MVWCSYTEYKCSIHCFLAGDPINNNGIRGCCGVFSADITDMHIHGAENDAGMCGGV